MSDPCIDRAIEELRRLDSALSSLEVFAYNLHSPEWLGYRGGMQDARMYLRLALERLEGENHGL